MATRASMMQTIPTDIKVGVRVQVLGKLMGTVKFAGVTKFAAGPWVGVELERGVGACLGVAFRSVAFRPIHVDVDGTISGC
eukprot:g30445.t1